MPKPGSPPPASIYDHALTVGFSRAFVVAAGIGLLALLIAIATIRVGRQELAGAVPEPQEAAQQPAASEPAAQQPAESPPTALQPAASPPTTLQSTAPQPGMVQRHEDRAAFAAAARPCRFC